MKPQVEPIEPAVPMSQQGNVARCVAPQERAQWVHGKVKRTEPFIFTQEVAACRSVESKSSFVIFTPFNIEVRELIYPGGPDDWAWPEGKWIYVFHERKLVAQAHAMKETYWKGTTFGKGNSKNQYWYRKNGVAVDPGSGEKSPVYWFFLSPVELTKKALEYLIQHKDFTRLAVSCAADAYGKTVYVPDPFHWASECHRKYYMPLVNKLRECHTDEELTSKDFIAAVLKKWVEGPEGQTIAKHLKPGEPDAWIEKRKKELKSAKDAAEQAGAYLGYCVYSPEYKAVLDSCTFGKLEAARLGAAALASIMDGLPNTESGKLLIRSLAYDPDGLFCRLLFYDGKAPVFEGKVGQAPAGAEKSRSITPLLDFKEFRWTWLAVLAIFEKALPAYLGIMKGRISKEKERELIAKYLKNIGIYIGADLGKVQSLGAVARQGSISFEEQRALVQDYLARNKMGDARQIADPGIRAAVEDLREGRAFNTEEARRGYQRLRKEAGVMEELPERFLAHEANGLHQNYEKSFSRLAGGVDIVVQVANLMVAIREFDELRHEKKDGPWYLGLFGLSGASADAAAAVLTFMGLLVREEAKARLMHGAGVAGIVSGIVDMYEFNEKYEEAEYGERDFGKALGYSAQSAGSLCVALGAAITLGAGMTESLAFLGPASLAVGLAGALLVFTGAVIVHYLKLTPNESFARVCFLRKSSWSERPKNAWITYQLPAESAIVERKALEQLLANFQVQGRAPTYPPWTASIKPGLLYPNSRFEVEIERVWKKGSLGLYRTVRHVSYRLRVDNERILQTAGPRLSKYGLYRRDGVIDEIYIELQERGDVPVWPNGLPDEIYEVEVKTRLMLDSKFGDDGETEGSVWVPKENAMVLVLPKAAQALSIDEATWGAMRTEPDE